MDNLDPTLTDAYLNEAMNLQKKSFAGAWEGKFGTLEYEAVMEEKRDVAIPTLIGKTEKKMFKRCRNIN